MILQHTINLNEINSYAETSTEKAGIRRNIQASNDATLWPLTSVNSVISTNIRYLLGVDLQKYLIVSSSCYSGGGPSAEKRRDVSLNHIVPSWIQKE